MADKTNAKKYRIIKAFIPKTFVHAEPSKNIQAIDDFAIVVIDEDMPLKMKVKIATEDQMKQFAQEKIKIKMVGYGFQNGNQRNNPQEEKRAPYSLIGFLYSPEMMINHYATYGGMPPHWNKIDWGVNTGLLNGSTCSGDSGSGYFVEQNDIRYYVGTAGNGLGNSNCKLDGTVSYANGGAMSWFNAPYKFLDLLKTAENFVYQEKQKEFIRIEEEKNAAEFKIKQEEIRIQEEKNKTEEANAKAEAELKAKVNEEERLKAEARAIEILKNNQNIARKLYAGKPCNKIRSTKIVYDIKFTCIKKNKKLVWNQGI